MLYYFPCSSYVVSDVCFEMKYNKQVALWSFVFITLWTVLQTQTNSGMSSVYAQNNGINIWLNVLLTAYIITVNCS